MCTQINQLSTNMATGKRKYWCVRQVYTVYISTQDPTAADSILLLVWDVSETIDYALKENFSVSDSSYQLKVTKTTWKYRLLPIQFKLWKLYVGVWDISIVK